MTREEAIHELTEWREQMKNHGVPNWSTKLNALNMAIESLSADSVRFEVYRDIYVKYMNLKHKTEWIPCSERLPGEEGYYLCCNKGYLPFVSHYDGGQWYDFDGTTSRVDAWMPLPKSYGERREP